MQVLYSTRHLENTAQLNDIIHCYVLTACTLALSYSRSIADPPRPAFSRKPHLNGIIPRYLMIARDYDGEASVAPVLILIRRLTVLIWVDL